MIYRDYHLTQIQLFIFSVEFFFCFFFVSLFLVWVQFLSVLLSSSIWLKKFKKYPQFFSLNCIKVDFLAGKIRIKSFSLTLEFETLCLKKLPYCSATDTRSLLIGQYLYLLTYRVTDWLYSYETNAF